MNSSDVVSGLLVKLATRCNLDCNYCYWFSDENVYKKPAILTESAGKKLIERIKNYVNKCGLEQFHITFHGGEPLLYGKKRFKELCDQLYEASSQANYIQTFSVTTNGILIDNEWCDLFSRYDVQVCISLDGPEYINDRNRVDLKGIGSYQRVITGINCLEANNIKWSVLSVCDPSSNPIEVATHLVDVLGKNSFDILIPDGNHESEDLKSVALYYIELFDFWWTVMAKNGVRIRLFDNILLGLLGGQSKTQSIGLAPVTTVVIQTDGSIECLDVLRIAGSEKCETKLDVFENCLSEIFYDETFRSVKHASTKLNSECNECRYLKVCGGGHLSHRWSESNNYDNPSIYLSLIHISEPTRPY